MFDVAADCRVGWYQEGELFRVPDHQNDRECAGRRSFSDAVPEGLFIFFKDLQFQKLSSCNIVRVILYHLLLKFCHLGEISILAWHTWETSFLTNNVI